MSTKRKSDTVERKVRTLYALLATRTAQKALDVVLFDVNDAEFWAEKTRHFLELSDAQCTRWSYGDPRIKP